MIKPALPENENARLDSLKKYQVLDTIHEDEFDEITRLAAQICDSPISLISLIDEKRQWFKSNVGLEGTNETPREFAFCAHAILAPDDLLIVKDATKDQRFNDNPFVNGDPNIKFYAGAPLVNSEGFSLGTLCVIDRVSKDLDTNQINALKVLSNQVIKQLELRRKNIELNDMTSHLEIQNKELLNKQTALVAINQFVTQLVQETEVGKVVECIIDHLQKDFKFDGCTLFLLDDENKYLFDGANGVHTDFQVIPVDKRIQLGNGTT